MNILITFTCRNVTWKLKETSRLHCVYKSEHNVTKYRPNRACILLFWEVIKPFTLDLWQTTSAFKSKLYACDTSVGNSKFNA